MNNTNENNICGDQIRIYRKEKKLAQVDLAAAVKLDFNITLEQSDISEIERGSRGVKDFELDAIARVLEVDPTILLRP